MISVAGGAYFEKCEVPHWDQFYGSGGRAAAVLSNLSRKVELHTYVGRDGEENLDVLASSFSFHVEATRIPSTVRFAYFHGLSIPTLKRPTRSADPLVVANDVVLRYGFVEGDAIVRGRRVVYDPQSVSNPQPFHENGSEADELAIVANSAEARRMSGEREPRSIARELANRSGAGVVVIKSGPFGALVFSGGKSTVVPALKTNFVFPIGSGDVFAAAFAHFWGEKRLLPIEAASLASMGTALYCSTQTLPLPTVGRWSKDAFRQVQAGRVRKRSRIYLAGPFFTLAQRWIIDEARAQLSSAKCKVFSPLHEIGRGPATQVVPADLAALRRSDLVYAIVDGLDSGTLFEIGYARSIGKPVVAFVQSESREALKMLEGSGCVIESDFATSIYKANWAVLEK